MGDTVNKVVKTIDTIAFNILMVMFVLLRIRLENSPVERYTRVSKRKHKSL
jgi:hypothetical protein